MVARGRRDADTWKALIEESLDDAMGLFDLPGSSRPALRLHQRTGPLGHRVLVSEFDPMAYEVVFHLDDLAACVDSGWAEASDLVRFLAHHELGHAAELIALQQQGLNPYLHRVDKSLERWWQVHKWANLRLLSHALVNGLMDYAINQKLAAKGVTNPLSIEMVLGDLLRQAGAKPDSLAYLVRRDFLAHFNRVLFAARDERANAQRLQELLQRVVGTAQWGWVAAAVQQVRFGGAASYEEALPKVAQTLFPELQVDVQGFTRAQLPKGTRLPQHWSSDEVRLFHWAKSPKATSGAAAGS